MLAIGITRVQEQQSLGNAAQKKKEKKRQIYLPQHTRTMSSKKIIPIFRNKENGTSFHNIKDTCIKENGTSFHNIKDTRTKVNGTNFHNIKDTCIIEKGTSFHKI